MPRYIVATTQGWTRPSHGKTLSQPHIEAMVIDTHNNHQLVASWYSEGFKGLEYQTISRIITLGTAIHTAKQLNGIPDF